jgi:hypothetical protein
MTDDDLDYDEFEDDSYLLEEEEEHLPELSEIFDMDSELVNEHIFEDCCEGP